MSRTVEVTIILGKNGNGIFEFYETESGDFHRIEAGVGYSRDDMAFDLGNELLSWLELMKDEQNNAE